MKLIIWILILLAGIFVAVGITEQNKGAFVFAVIVFGVALYFGLSPQGILRREEIIDQWANLVEAGDGQSDRIFTQTEAFLEESEAPDIRWERKKIGAGVIQGVMGDQREFLVITDEQRHCLKPYQIYSHAGDYGKNLSTSWFLTFKPTIGQALWSLIPFVRLAPRDAHDLDLFESMDLRDYVTNAHRCFIRAVEGLAEELGQDVGKIDRKSKGVLEVW